MSVKNRILLCFLFLCPLVLSGAGKDVYDFAVSLYDRQEYFRAVSEFQRFMFFDPSDSRSPKAGFMIALSYYKAGQYVLAYDSALRMTNNSRFRFKSKLLAADSLFKLDRYPASAVLYGQITATLADDKAELLYRSAWPRLMEKDFVSSVKLYEELLATYPSWNGKSDTEMLRDSTIRISRVKPLSPPLAGVMSAVIPGLGQFYTKRPGDGLIAFTAVAVFGVGSWLLWKYNDYKEINIAVTLVAGFFYAGNIYSAWASANKYNLLYYQKNLGALRDNYWHEYDYEKDR